MRLLLLSLAGCPTGRTNGKYALGRSVQGPASEERSIQAVADKWRRCGGDGGGVRLLGMRDRY
jgi:hypothetical protein